MTHPPAERHAARPASRRDRSRAAAGRRAGAAAPQPATPLGAPGAARRCWPAPRVLYLWDLGASGWANAFYSAAVQAGTKSWKAFFFGSLDAVELHHRRQAAGVAVGDGAVGADLRLNSLEHPRAAGARWASPRSACSTPRCALVRRRRRAARRRGPRADAGRRADVPVQQPGRAARAAADGAPPTRPCGRSRRPARGGCRWPASLVGFAFLTKMLQAFLVAARRSRSSTWSPRPTPLRRRLVQLLAAGAAMVVGRRLVGGARRAVAGAARARTSAARRHNSILELTFGYNGLGRLTGSETGSVGGGGTAAAAASAARPGWTRLFSAEIGGQISWLLPAALVALVALAVADRPRAAHRPRRAPRCCSGAAGCSSPALVFSYAERHHPPVLHGRAGAGDRGARRHRRHAAVAAP